MKTLYTSALGYSDDKYLNPPGKNKWWTVLFYELRDGMYVPAPQYARRNRYIETPGEVREHQFALLGIAGMMEREDELIHLFQCDCDTVIEISIRRDKVAVRCPGCGLVWDTEQAIKRAIVYGSISDVVSKLTASMAEMAAAQGYTVGASYSGPERR